MTEAEPTKQQLIDEINRLVADWQPKYCRYLLEEAQRWDEAASAPPRPKDDSGKEFTEVLAIHARNETTQAALCGHKGAEQLVSVEEFEKLAGKWKCESCVNLVNKKLRGEKVPYERTNWLKPSQEELMKAIYLAGGRQANEWCTTERLFREAKYSSRGSLWTALRTLQQHKVIEMRRQGNVCSVRLACDCVVEIKSGELVIAVGKVQDAEKPKRKA